MPTQLLQLTFNPGLSGPVPSEIGRLHHLRQLYAWNTSFTGPLPTALSALTSLQALDLTDNMLTGALPPELTGLAKVNTFYLDGNPGLECPLPEGVQRWLDANVSFNAVCVPNATQVVW